MAVLAAAGAAVLRDWRGPRPFRPRTLDQNVQLLGNPCEAVVDLPSVLAEPAVVAEPAMVAEPAVLADSARIAEPAVVAGPVPRRQRVLAAEPSRHPTAHRSGPPPVGKTLAGPAARGARRPGRTAAGCAGAGLLAAARPAHQLAGGAPLRDAGLRAARPGGSELGTGPVRCHPRRARRGDRQPASRWRPASASDRVDGVRAWLAAFEHYWTDWQPRPASTPDAPVTEISLHSTGESAMMADLAQLLGRLDGTARRRLLLRHRGHPGAAGLARSIAVEAPQIGVTVLDESAARWTRPAEEAAAAPGEFYELRACAATCCSAWPPAAAARAGAVRSASHRASCCS